MRIVHCLEVAVPGAAAAVVLEVWTAWDLRCEGPAESTATCDEIVGVGAFTVIRATLHAPRLESRPDLVLVTTYVNALDLMHLYQAQPRLAVEVRTVEVGAVGPLPPYERAVEWR